VDPISSTQTESSTVGETLQSVSVDRIASDTFGGQRESVHCVNMAGGRVIHSRSQDVPVHFQVLQIDSKAGHCRVSLRRVVGFFPEEKIDNLPLAGRQRFGVVINTIAHDDVFEFTGSSLIYGQDHDVLEPI